MGDLLFYHNILRLYLFLLIQIFPVQFGTKMYDLNGAFAS